MYSFYRTVNLVNGKYYLGVHRERYWPVIDTSYLGSGKAITRAIKKYGWENFQREILGLYENEPDAYAVEKLYVDEHKVKDRNCYNMVLGGLGGYKGGVKPPKPVIVHDVVYSSVVEAIEFAGLCTYTLYKILKDADNHTCAYL